MPSYEILFEDYYSLYVALDDNGDSDILDFLENTTNKASKNEAKTMLRRLIYLSKGNKLPANVCHRVDDKHQIWQIRSEFHRILWFYHKGKIIVCTHIFEKKKEGRTPKEEKDRAMKMQKHYIDTAQK